MNGLTCFLIGALLLAFPAMAEKLPKRIPVIDVTDLYHPPQDCGDNMDLIAAYALPEIDLRAVILDCTAGFRKPKSDHPGLGTDPDGPRDPGFIPVTQLNCIFGRNVPCATGPFSIMKSAQDKMLDLPPFQQHGIELILQTLQRAKEEVEIVSFGSARPVAVAFNREPKLFLRKVRRIHLCAGSCDPGFLEWNVVLDPQAMVCLLQSRLPIAIYPCATKDGPFAYSAHNTFWRLPNLQFIARMQPELRRYLVYAIGRSKRTDFLRALEEEPEAQALQAVLSKTHNVWETLVWLNVTGRKLVRRADGHHRIVAATQLLPTDQVLPNELHPCQVEARPDGTFAWTEKQAGTAANFWIIDRGDPKVNETACREALPAWYEALGGR